MSQANKECHDFNWVKARQECSLALEFVRLLKAVQGDTRERQKGLKKQELKVQLSFEADANGLEFMVIRTGNGSPRCVSFALQRGTITVTKNESNPADNFDLTLTFTDKGEYRFKVNGKGEYLRWQVSRKSLEEIFFYGLFEKESQ